MSLFRNSNFITRCVTSIFLIPLVIYSIASSHQITMLITTMFVGVTCGFEWNDLVLSKIDEKSKKHKILVLFGMIYISIPMVIIVQLRTFEYGKDILTILFFVVFATDTIGYGVGKKLGNLKLAPKISPNKTVMGAVAGLIVSFIIGAIAALILTTSMLNALLLTLFCVFLSVASQIGDLFESYIKRLYDKKDSGNILPGHGGMLDRVDGLLFAAPTIFFSYPFLKILFQ